MNPDQSNSLGLIGVSLPPVVDGSRAKVFLDATVSGAASEWEGLFHRRNLEAILVLVDEVLLHCPPGTEVGIAVDFSPPECALDDEYSCRLQVDRVLLDDHEGDLAEEAGERLFELDDLLERMATVENVPLFEQLAGFTATRATFPVAAAKILGDAWVAERQAAVIDAGLPAAGSAPRSPRI